MENTENNRELYFENGTDYQQPYETQDLHLTDDDASGLLDESQRRSIDEILNGTVIPQDISETDFLNAMAVAEEIVSDSSGFSQGQDTYREYMSFLTNAHEDAVKHVNVFDREEAVKFIITMLEDYIYPTQEVRAFAEYARNGGTFQDFIESVKPVDFSNLSDEDVLQYYYKNRMEESALQDYIETLKDTGKLNKKANEIRKEVGVVQLTPDEIVARQKEILAQQEAFKAQLRNGIENSVKQLNLKFKSRSEKEEFINSLVETNHFYDDSDRLVYVGNTFSYVLNSDVNALVIAAYSLFSYSDEAEKRKSNMNIIENVKKNLIQSRSMGINY